MKLLRKGNEWCSDSVVTVLSGEGEILNLKGKPVTRGRGRSWARYNPKSQKKHNLARRVKNCWSKLLRVITDFFLS